MYMHASLRTSWISSHIRSHRKSSASRLYSPSLNQSVSRIPLTVLNAASLLSLIMGASFSESNLYSAMVSMSAMLAWIFLLTALNLATALPPSVILVVSSLSIREKSSVS